MDERITGPLSPTTTGACEPASNASATPPPADGASFRDALRDAARSLAAGEASIDAAVARLGRGRSLSPEELIALQATVYRHAAEVEMAAKLVDKLTGAVRTALTSQQ